MILIVYSAFRCTKYFYINILITLHKKLTISVGQLVRGKQEESVFHLKVKLQV